MTDHLKELMVNIPPNIKAQADAIEEEVAPFKPMRIKVSSEANEATQLHCMALVQELQRRRLKCEIKRNNEGKTEIWVSTRTR